ncbi:MAG: GWxTD domain-containing protein [Candidatus Zixiibacteriota bacterium]
MCTPRSFAIQIVALICLITAAASADEVEDINLARSKFFIDHAVFADTGQNRLEVYYKIFNDGLHYIKKGEKYVANYEISIIVTGDKDRQVTGRSVERNYVLDSYEMTKSEVGFLINQVSLPLPSGEFEMKCKMIDHNSNDASTIESKIKSPAFRPEGDFSEIEFVQDVQNVDPASVFSKGGIPAVPSVERSFDGELHKLGFYAELYVRDYVGKTVDMIVEVKAKHSEMSAERTTTVQIDSARMPVTEFIDVTGLSPGEYMLIVKLRAEGKQFAQREARFLLKWSLESLLKNDYEYAVDQLKYITSKDDKKMLMAAADSDRVMTFEAWWKGKDPTPTTPENELREEYYRRIRYSDQYFSTVGREGWLTDRGMIYIRWGEPDQIDRYPFELGKKPYQIWYYYTQRRAFYFVDDRGDGDLQLQYPYDGDWRSRGSMGP